MSATKRPSRPVVQRVAKNLIRRGNGYTFRKVIPSEAQSAFGGVREYVRSLGDVTRKEADELAALHRAYCNRLIAEARGKSKPKVGVVELIRVRRTPDREEIERAVRRWLLDREDDLGTSLFGVGGEQKVRDIQHIEGEVVRIASPKARQKPLLTSWIAEGLAEANGWALPPEGELRRFVEDRVGRAQYELSKRVGAEQEIGKVHQPTHPMFAPGEFNRDERHQSKQVAPVSIKALFESYLEKRKPAPKTVKKWTGAINSLTAHLGHDDAGRVSSEDIIAWKDVLLAQGKAGETVRNGYIGAVRTVFGAAKRNRVIPANPAEGIFVETSQRPTNRPEKGFTNAEAKQVLAASFAIDTQVDQSFGAFARRWLPWLCAFSGARVGEMAQLRREDVAQTEEGIWFVVIRPEAGSQKSNFARQVALHPQLIELGFIDAVERRSGPLFYDPSRRRDGSTGNPQYTKAAQRVAEWVRGTVGIVDRELQPNHGWRHRFRTVATRIRMPPEVCRAILGHAPKDVHETYGNVPLETINEWISLMPRYEVQSGSAAVSEPRQPIATAAE